MRRRSDSLPGSGTSGLRGGRGRSQSLSGTSDPVLPARAGLQREIGSLGTASLGAMRRELRASPTFERQKALETVLGERSRTNKAAQLTQQRRHVPRRMDVLPPPQLMASDQPRRRVKVGVEGDSLVFARPKTSGDMVHFTSTGGATGIGRHGIMYPSMLDTKSSAHFGPGVYFTDRDIVRRGAPPGRLTHDSVQEAIYTRATPQNATRSSHVIETAPSVFRQHPVNTYEILPSRLPQMQAERTRRRREGVPMTGLSAEWHAGDTGPERRVVHKIETTGPVRVDLRRTRTTSSWARSQPPVPRGRSREWP